MQKKRSEYMKTIEEHEDQLHEIRTKLKTTEVKINEIVSEMQKTETKLGKSKDAFEKVQADIRLMKEELNRIERFRSPKERSLLQCKSSLEAMNSTKSGLESELHQELMAQLSVQDQQEVDQLNDDIRRLNQENKAIFSSRMSTEVSKNKIENLLTNNLIRRRDELQQALLDITRGDRKQRLIDSQNDLTVIAERIRKVNVDLEEMDRNYDKAVKQQKSLQKELDGLIQKEKDLQDKIDQDAKSYEKWASKENLFRQKIDECTEKIANLGALPVVEPQYTKMSLKKVKIYFKLFKNLFKECYDLIV
jgi:structural maintenance of chromosome 3 (chondroitin sulfate proteoglycan 6)